MKKFRNTALFLFVLLLVVSNCNIVGAAKISSKSYAMMVGETITLRVLDTKKTVKWSSSNKAVASVDKKGNVKAKKAGEAVITAKIGKSTYSCKIKATKAVNAILYNKGSVTESPEPTGAPETPEPTKTPDPTKTPEPTTTPEPTKAAAALKTSGGESNT